MAALQVNHGAGDGQPADESDAWLAFVGQCHAAVERVEQGGVSPHSTFKLLAAATRLRTRAARVLALAMLTRVAGHLTGSMGAPAPSRHLLDGRTERPANPRAASVLAYIDEHHSRSSCRLEEIARTLRVSRSYLSRLVLRETGLTFNRQLQLARMNTAARLLQSSHLSVKEISSAAGYEHVPSFDRQFRKHFGMTPGEFRRGLRI